MCESDNFFGRLRNGGVTIAINEKKFDFSTIFGPPRRNLWTMIPQSLDRLAEIFGPPDSLSD